MEGLSGALEFNLIYGGFDQQIDSVSVGLIPPGNHEFDFITENGGRRQPNGQNTKRRRSMRLLGYASADQCVGSHGIFAIL